MKDDYFGGYLFKLEKGPTSFIKDAFCYNEMDGIQNNTHTHAEN